MSLTTKDVWDSILEQLAADTELETRFQTTLGEISSRFDEYPWVEQTELYLTPTTLSNLTGILRRDEEAVPVNEPLHVFSLAPDYVDAGSTSGCIEFGHQFIFVAVMQSAGNNQIYLCEIVDALIDAIMSYSIEDVGIEFRNASIVNEELSNNFVVGIIQFYLTHSLRLEAI